MAGCKRCEEGDPGTNVTCWDCGGVFHIHRAQYSQVPEGCYIMAKCPSCGKVNLWEKKGSGMAYSGPVIYYGQPIIDMREKR